MESIDTKKIESSAISILAGIVLLFGFMRIVMPYAEGIFLGSAIPDGHSTVQETPVDPFAQLSLSAHSAFVWDIEKQEPLFAMNESVQLPLASLTKIMTALVASEGKDSDSTVVVNKDSILEEGDHGFIAGEKWRLKDLIDATLLTSSNDGAHVLASLSALTVGGEENTKSFLSKANAKAKELGLEQTFFINGSGLDVNSYLSGGYGSARDFALLLEYTLLKHPSLMEATSRTLLSNYSVDGKVHNFENTNKHVEFLPGIIASKTGFTDLAGGNLAIAFDAGISHPVVIVVLGSTAEDRFFDVEQLLFASLESLK